MTQADIEWLWVPSIDAHLNEYLPDCWQRRTWLSGFSGSAGDALVGKNDAWVFVDSRYHTQVDTEVDTDCWSISKLGLPNHQTPFLFLETQLKTAKNNKLTLGFDSATVTLAQHSQWEKLASKGLTLSPTHKNLIDAVWQNDSPPPPALPSQTVYGLSDKVTGQSAAKKLEKLQSWLIDKSLDAVIITKLDQIAWLFNARGEDIPYNPVFLAYALITPAHAWLLTEPSRIDKALTNKLSKLATLAPYNELPKTLEQCLRSNRKQASKQSTGSRIALDPKHSTMWAKMLVNEHSGSVVETTVPIELWKAVKNNVELVGMRQANHQAGVAITQALDWLTAQQLTKQPVSEANFADYLESCYAAQPNYKGLSFNTIAGFGSNSAIVHYGTPCAKTKIRPGKFFLVDSGAQYLSGTTDCTRTVFFGRPTSKHKTIYTAVLKAHIDCASTVFPEGTNGAQLDSICRRALWQEHLDFGHGTGHGVGAFLNVHEGPNGIHKRAVTPLEPGMITSIEPGYYEAGWGGVRLENLYEIIDTGKTLPDGRKLFTFAALCHVRFDANLINNRMLETNHLTWLENYTKACPL